MKPTREVINIPRPPVQRTILNATAERARELSEYVMEHAEGLPDWAKKIVEKERQNGGKNETTP